MPSASASVPSPARRASREGALDAGSAGARFAAESREEGVRARFVRDLLARLPRERVAEVHLFAPMRQGGTESGVAVVAVRPTDEGAPTGAPEHAADGPPRHTVFTATYRLAVRGPDRGRWQVDVREEADAPLVTVEAVVRGVQRRAGDASPPARLDADAAERLAELGLTPGAPAGGGA